MTQPSDRARKAADWYYSQAVNSRERLTEAFARFERETFAAGVEAAAKCAEELGNSGFLADPQVAVRAHVRNIAAAIRALTPASPAFSRPTDPTPEHYAEWGITDGTAPPASEGLDAEGLVEALNNPTPEMWEAAWNASEDYFVSDDVSKRGLEAALRAFVSAALSSIRPALDAERKD